MTHKATTWNSCYPDDPLPGLLHLEPPALSGDESFSVHCSGGTSEEKDEVACRITALWNAAEELGLTTEKIEEGEIQAIFFRNQEQSKLIGVVLERIEKLESVNAELERELDFAIDRFDYLKAENAEMSEVIAKLLQVVELYEPANMHQKLIRRAEATIEGDAS